MILLARYAQWLALALIVAGFIVAVITRMAW